MVKLEHISGIEGVTGLSEEEAKARLAFEGFNELPTAKKRTLLDTCVEVMKEPMFLLLVACGSIYLFLGFTGIEPEALNDAVMLFCFVGIVIGITIYQERKVERALDALKDLSSPRALVIRDAKVISIPSREVVRGDYLVLSEGDRVPADVRMVSCSNLLVDESLLTGESVPVRKAASEDNDDELSRPGGDDLPFAYSSTLVVAGHGIGQVIRVGINTEIGKIGRALESLEPEETPLQKETGRLVRIFAAAGGVVCLLVIFFYALTTGDLMHGFLTGLSLAMALVPEEIPVVLTVFLALGAWRMSRHNVLTRRLQAIQTLGSTTTLCVDKTGTLTLNRMQLRTVFAQGKFFSFGEQKKHVPEEFHVVIEYSILASQAMPFDPMEKALVEAGKESLVGTEHLHENWTLVKEYALSRKLLALAHAWKSPDGSEYVIAAKGAPEAIFDLCHMDSSLSAALEQKVHLMARDGLRVLGVAKATASTLPTQQHDFEFEFIGLVGFHDPVRPNVAESVKECYEAGIRVIMITGDYPVTAQDIARQAGITPYDQIITGPELEKMSEAELKERIKTACVFARVVPEQKLLIVNALKANNEIVVMTGDGVNDAPALKAANIGIAMGGRGTEVAREASALVLLDDDFSSIVQAVRLGRRIFDNIRKAIAYIFAIHVPIAGMSLIPVLFQWPLVLLPVHILFLELIIDPACSTIFEAEAAEADVMRRPPRDPREPLFSRRNVLRAVLEGLAVLAVVLAVFGLALSRGQGENEARALSYTTLIIANLGLILSNRSRTRTILQTLRTPNWALWWVLGGATVFLTLVLSVPFLRGLFKFAALHPVDIAICLAAGIFSILFAELFKLRRR